MYRTPSQGTTSTLRRRAVFSWFESEIATSSHQLEIPPPLSQLKGSNVAYSTTTMFAESFLAENSTADRPPCFWYIYVLVYHIFNSSKLQAFFSIARAICMLYVLKSHTSPNSINYLNVLKVYILVCVLEEPDYFRG